MGEGMRFKVTGESVVAGVKPGGVIEEFPEGTDVEALIAGGHIEPVREKPRKEVKPDGGLPAR